MAFIWVISQLDSIPSLDGMDKVISVIHYRAQKVFEYFPNPNLKMTETGIVDTNGALSVDAPHEASFTPYDEVTKKMVEGWLESSLDCEAIEANLDAQIENFLNPPIVNYGLPWVDPAKI
jgi:hypothetical protein